MSCLGGMLTTYIESPRTLPLPDKPCKKVDESDNKKQEIWTVNKGRRGGMV